MKREFNKINEKESKGIAAETQQNFYSWLTYSQLTEQEWIKQMKSGIFHIQQGQDSETEYIEVGILTESGIFLRIGERIHSPFPSSVCYREFQLDSLLLLLYMANKLDALWDRRKEDQEYFYRKVKRFAKTYLMEQ